MPFWYSKSELLSIKIGTQKNGVRTESAKNKKRRKNNGIADNVMPSTTMLAGQMRCCTKRLLGSGEVRRHTNLMCVD
jgi:hypothetical protein